MIDKERLALKQKIKSKIPSFLRENYAALPRLKKAHWRKGKGIHSKARHGFAGHRNRVEPGYGTPAELRGIGKNGLRQVLVHNLNELEKISTQTEGAIIAKMGKQNKIVLIKRAQEKKIAILNIKNPTEYITKIEQEFKQRTEAKKKIQEKKEKTRKETKENKKQEAPKTENDAKPTTAEQQQKEKKELDKLLTRKE